MVGGFARGNLFPTALVSFLLFFASQGALPSQGAERTLRVVGSWGELTLYRNVELPFWTRRLAEASGGRLKAIMTSLSEIKVSPQSLIRAMGNNAFDVASLVADYLAQEIPELGGMVLASLGVDAPTARRAIEAYRPFVERALRDRFGAKVLAVLPYPSQVVFSLSPMGGLSDLRGKRVRAPGWITSKLVEAFGGTPVRLEFDKVLQALKGGVLECAITGTTPGYLAGWGEATRYLYPFSMGYMPVLVAMNFEAWRALSPEEREVLQRASRELLEDVAWDEVEGESQRGMACLLAGPCDLGTPSGMAVLGPNPEDARALAEALRREVLPQWAARVGRKGFQEWLRTAGAVLGLEEADLSQRRP